MRYIYNLLIIIIDNQYFIRTHIYLPNTENYLILTVFSLICLHGAQFSQNQDSTYT